MYIQEPAKDIYLKFKLAQLLCGFDWSGFCGSGKIFVVTVSMACNSWILRWILRWIFGCKPLEGSRPAVYNHAAGQHQKKAPTLQ